MENQVDEMIKIKLKNLVFFGFIIIYTILIIYLSKEINVYEDEAYSLNTSSLSFKTVISQSYNFEGQPPAYFLLLALWRTINSGIFFARFLSVLFIILSAFLIYKIVRLFSDIGNARWMAVIFLLNPFSVWAALEIRTYPMLIFLSSFSILLYLKYYLYNQTKYLYWFLLLCLIGIYTQYFFSFLMIALAVSVLIFRGWRAFLKICIYFIPLILLFLPNLYFIIKNLEIAQSANSDYGLFERLSVILHTPQNLMIALHMGSLNVYMRWGIKIILVLIILISYYSLYRNREGENRNSFKFTSEFLATGLTLVLLYSIFNAIAGIRYEDKYMSIAFPVFILIFSLIGTLTLLFRRIIYVTISLYFIFLLIFIYIPVIKTYDYKYLAEYITEIEEENEPILCYSDLISISLVYYYNGRNKLAPLPENPSFDDNYVKCISDTTNLKKEIEKKYGISRSYLFISDDLRKFSLDLDMNREMIDKYLNTNYKITLDTLYYGRSKTLYMRVRRLETIEGD